MKDKLLRLWGKTKQGSGDPEEFHPAIFHMLDVGNVARALLSRDASPRWRRMMSGVLGAEQDKMTNWLPWLIALHDIGKVSAAFQQANEGQWKRLEAEGFYFGDRLWNNHPYHALISAVFINSNKDGLELSNFLRQGWQDAIAGHHGEFSGREALREAKFLLKAEPPEWAELRFETSRLLKDALMEFSPDPWLSPPNLSSVIMAITGFTVLCDWIGSDEKNFCPMPNCDWQDYSEKSFSRAVDAVRDAGFFQSTVSTAPLKFKKLFYDLKNPRCLQLAIDSIPSNILTAPCLAIIEAPTGEGKTEAALALAHKLAQENESDEFYYALPTTATSNQMFSRLKQHIGTRLGLSDNVRLIHGQAFLSQDNFLEKPLQNGKEHSAAPDWFGSDKRKSLLAPFGVGTIDQAELAALNVRFTVLRLIGLAGKVVILDEVHAYDTYMTTIVERLLNWLSTLGTSVVLLSATLPTSRRGALLQAYGIKTTKTENNQLTYPNLYIASRAGFHIISPEVYQPERELRVGYLHFDDDEPIVKARWLLNCIAEGGCVCWITNTVRRAQKIFEQVDCLASHDIDRMLLHARFPLEDRQMLETDLTNKYSPNGKRPFKGIVIGTQVLEQSLDLDFDVMVSDLAPIDFILQRAGRLHRHSCHTRPLAHRYPHLWINIPQSTDGSPTLTTDKTVYDEFILYKTLALFSGRGKINLPADYRLLVESVYNTDVPPEDYPLRAAWEKLQKKQERARGEARLRLLPEPDAESSFCGQLANLTFEESENKAGWLVAQTRLGEESLTVIPLERQGNTACLYPRTETVLLDTEASRVMQKKLMRRSIQIGNRYLISALKDTESQKPPLFTRSALLKECYPLWLTEGKANIPFEKGVLFINLQKQLGLVIEKEVNE